MFPNLYCPGAAKSGTSTLYNILEQHPDVFFSYTKELHFFNSEWHRGFDWYEKCFEKADGQKYICDFSPAYMILEDFPKKIMKLSGPGTKFIFMLRNPVDRIFSHYWLLKNLMKDPGISIEEMTAAMENGSKADGHRLINIGFYHKHIKNFLRTYPMENLHFIIFEDFIKDIEGESRKVFNFLGLEVMDSIDFNIWENRATMPENKIKRKVFFGIIKIIPDFVRESFPSAFKHKIRHFLAKFLLTGKKIEVEKDPELCRRLIKIYEKDINDLEKLLDRDLSHWKQKYSGAL